MFIHALAFLALLAVEPRLERAESQARAFLKATQERNYGAVVDLTNPKYIKMMGGRESALKEMKKEFDGIAEGGITLEPFKMEAPSDLRQTKDGRFCLVHHTIRIKGKGKVASVKGMLLGVSTDDGKNWTFVQAANGEQYFRRLLPEIPDSLKFPKIDQSQVIEGQP